MISVEEMQLEICMDALKKIAELIGNDSAKAIANRALDECDRVANQE